MNNQQQFRDQNRIRGTMFNRTKGSKGKYKPKYKQKDFWKHYYSGVYSGVIPFSKASSVIEDLLKGTANLLFNDDYIFFPKIGFFGIAETYKSMKYRMINWPKTEELWKDMYGELLPSEFKKIKDKPMIEYEGIKKSRRGNKVCWDKPENAKTYKFLAVSHINRKIAKETQDNKLAVMNIVDFREFTNNIRKNH